jgi:hypothetical protein
MFGYKTESGLIHVLMPFKEAKAPKFNKICFGCPRTLIFIVVLAVVIDVSGCGD